MAPKKKEAGVVSETVAPPAPKVEEELQRAIVTKDPMLSKKLQDLKEIAERPCRVLLYMCNVKPATQELLTRVVQHTPATCVELCLIYCEQLTELPQLSALTGLRSLSLNMCDRLKALPELPARLELLDLGWCESLSSIPSDLTALTELRKLDCAGCKNLQSTWDDEPPKLPPQLKLTWNPENRTGLRKPDQDHLGRPKVPQGV